MGICLIKIGDIRILQDKFQYFFIDFYFTIVYDILAKYGYQIFDKYIKYSESNTIYANLCYDKYRNMYYRIMTIPTHTSPDSMTKSNLQSWLLIVADSTFSIKYNVLFENTTYIPKLYITTKGVYLIDASSIKNRRYEIFDLFVFDKQKQHQVQLHLIRK